MSSRWTLEWILEQFRSSEICAALRELGLMKSAPSQKHVRIQIFLETAQGDWHSESLPRSLKYVGYRPGLGDWSSDVFFNRSTNIGGIRLKPMFEAFSEAALSRVCVIVGFKPGPKREMARILAQSTGQIIERTKPRIKNFDFDKFEELLGKFRSVEIRYALRELNLPIRNTKIKRIQTISEDARFLHLSGHRPASDIAAFEDKSKQRVCESLGMNSDSPLDSYKLLEEWVTGTATVDNAHWRSSSSPAYIGPVKELTQSASSTGKTYAPASRGIYPAIPKEKSIERSKPLAHVMILSVVVGLAILAVVLAVVGKEDPGTPLATGKSPIVRSSNSIAPPGNTSQSDLSKRVWSKDQARLRLAKFLESRGASYIAPQRVNAWTAEYRGDRTWLVTGEHVPGGGVFVFEDDFRVPTIREYEEHDIPPRAIVLAKRYLRSTTRSDSTGCMDAWFRINQPSVLLPMEWKGRYYGNGIWHLYGPAFEPYGPFGWSPADDIMIDLKSGEVSCS